MAQPNDFGFGEEAAMLKDAARKFFADNLPVEALHQLVADDHDPDRGPTVTWRDDLWRQMVELGWTTLAIPESAGGLGMPLAAVAGLVEELGRAAFSLPIAGYPQRHLCAGGLWRFGRRGTGRHWRRQGRHPGPHQPRR